MRRCSRWLTHAMISRYVYRYELLLERGIFFSFMYIFIYIYIIIYARKETQHARICIPIYITVRFSRFDGRWSVGAGIQYCMSSSKYSVYSFSDISTSSSGRLSALRRLLTSSLVTSMQSSANLLSHEYRTCSNSRPPVNGEPNP